MRKGVALGHLAYVGINSIRHPDELFRHLGTIFSVSNFNRSVLLCIEADFCNQICVGMKDPSALRMERKALDEIYNFHILLAS